MKVLFLDATEAGKNRYHADRLARQLNSERVRLSQVRSAAEVIDEGFLERHCNGIIICSALGFPASLYLCECFFLALCEVLFFLAHMFMFCRTNQRWYNSVVLK